MIEQLTREEAIKFANEKVYEYMSFKEIAIFQVTQEKLCMPFSVFHKAVEKTIGRPVLTHEFAVNASGIRVEIELAT